MILSLQSWLLIRAWRLGLWTPPDRRVLDETILPYYARTSGFSRLLFVGVKKYNAKNRKLMAGRTYVTIDPEPAFARHGGDRHIQDGLQNLAEHVVPGSFDVIVVNGVIGHGLDAAADVDRALAACCDALRMGGHLVIGLNEENPSAVKVHSREPMNRFRGRSFEPLGVSQYVVQTPLRERTHSYFFFERIA